MLQSLTIENYALIDKLHITFPGGLSIITGETGAGKSILLGALSLILGQRADTSALKDDTKNCVVEGEFSIDGYGLSMVFEDNDIDYAPVITLRRMIVPGGKSRAFVNDVPVTLNVLKELGERLIDIHSQHQNLILNSSAFQMSVLDAQAGNNERLQQYRKIFSVYKTTCTQWQALQEKAERSKADYDYLQFQYNELQTVQLKPGEQQALEDELTQLTHAEDIKLALAKGSALLQEDENSVDNLLRDAGQSLQRIAAVLPAAAALAERIASCRVELRDVASEIASDNEKISTDANRLAVVESRLNTLYALQQKHRVDSVEALLALQEQLGKNIYAIENYDRQLAELQAASARQLEQVKEQAVQLSQHRKKIIPSVTQYITGMLRLLGMPHAVFTISITETEFFTAAGNDTVQFLFSANKEILPQEISRVASGGEISRLMLCLKSLLVKGSGLPAIIFDEIDTGVSGEVADKMGSIIYGLSKNMQVINITHLPQIASKGNAHFTVYKELDAAGATVTRMKLLSVGERVMEIAKMLSGQNITQAAIDNAKELLAGGEKI
ncbi:MAG: DNA repair protein RecN [Prevotellaceae bacterium]|jgi:DNA repair protein RecN (Recombination protein N)|nr:DNA repair protein RecN [Prevotellaceae bacterium]